VSVPARARSGRAGILAQPSRQQRQAQLAVRLSFVSTIAFHPSRVETEPGRATALAAHGSSQQAASAEPGRAAVQLNNPPGRPSASGALCLGVGPSYTVIF